MPVQADRQRGLLRLDLVLAGSGRDNWAAPNGGETASGQPLLGLSDFRQNYFSLRRLRFVSANVLDE